MKRSDMLNIDAGENISHTRESVKDNEMEKIKNIRDRIQIKRKERLKRQKSGK